MADTEISAYGIGHSRASRLPPLLLAAVFVALLFGSAASVKAAMTPTLEPSVASPAPVGTLVTWTAQVPDADPANLWFRFRIRAAGETYRVIRDFGPLATLAWTSTDEGEFEIELSAQDRTTLEVATISFSFVMESRTGNGQAVVSPTSHPLVALFSSPSCGTGWASVEIRASDGSVLTTPARPCTPGTSMNVYLAGLQPNASYYARLVLQRERDTTPSAPVNFLTGSLPSSVIPAVVQHLSPPATAGILLEAPLYLPPIALDLNGTVLWYGPSDLTYMTFVGPDGTFFGLIESGTDPSRFAVRQFDLLGTTVRETNVARVNEQLAAMGKRKISAFHHEARALADGRTVVLGDVEQILTDVQGPGPVDVIGDMIIVLDSDFQVVWTWDAFDHLDTSRRAVMGETCVADVGCAPYFLSADANDWLHGNSVAEAPDGALLYSARHQDWLIKIDYDHGSGNGDVIWRLGKDGDFTLDSGDPLLWFSHQHDAGYEPGGRPTITLFDNGNTRRASDSTAHSRGQAIELDEGSRTAHLVLNADLGLFSQALGAAQKLSDGSFHFDAGFVAGGSSGQEAFSFQVDPTGGILSSIQYASPVYRSFRLENLYGVLDTPAKQPTRLVGPRP